MIRNKNNEMGKNYLIRQSEQLFFPIGGTPGANLTYLAPPRQFFMGAKSFIGRGGGAR